jgi:8-hydroxy-5-deazaflavin:NADPH oxidoreductase
MKIAILGAGNAGGALAKGLANAGHHIILGVRDRSSEKVRRAMSQHPTIKAATVADGVQNAGVVLLALPISTVVDVARQCGNLSDKVVIDATNTVSQKPTPYATATEAFKELTKCNDIAKCFNSTGFENMENPNFDGTRADMFMAGDSEKAKNIAAQLAKEIGFGECYDFGGDDKIPLLEQFAMVWINLAIFQKVGRNIAFKILKRK